MLKRPVLWALLIFLLAFGLRLVYIEQIKTNPFFDSPVIDAHGYDKTAVQIARGDLDQDGIFRQAPLYSYWLGALYTLFGRDHYAARLVQIALGSLSCVLIFRIGSLAFSWKTGLLAGLMASIYGTLIFHDAELLRTSLVIFLALVTLLLLLSAAESKGSWKWAAAGLLLGFSALARENILLFVPFIFMWMFISLRGTASTGSLMQKGLVLLIATAAVILPVTVRNYIVGGDLVLISSQGGLNFYIGNNRDADRTIALQPGAGWDEMAGMPSRQHGLWKPSDQSRWFFSEALDFIVDDPVGWLRIMIKKFVFFWNGYEYTPNNDINFFRDKSPLLRALVRPGWIVIIPFGLIAPLALLGMALAAGTRPAGKILLLQLFVISYTVSVVLFHVRARYRLPVVPVLLVFTAYALQRLAAATKSREKPALIMSLVLLPLLFAGVNADFYGIRGTGDFPLEYNLGVAHLNSGRLKEAALELGRAAGKDPGNPNIHNSLGITFEKMGSYDEALAEYAEAIRLKPGYRGPHSNLGHLYFKRGMFEDARRELELAVEIDPSYAVAHNNLGMVYYETGLYRMAEEEYLAALSIKSGYANARYNLGLVYLAMEEYGQAVSEFEKAMALDPENNDARRGYSHALRMGKK